MTKQAPPILGCQISVLNKKPAGTPFPFCFSGKEATAQGGREVRAWLLAASTSPARVREASEAAAAPQPAFFQGRGQLF